MAHGFLCFCPRCMNDHTSKKGKNRGHLNGKPKPQTRPKQWDGPHTDSVKGNQGNGGGKRKVSQLDLSHVAKLAHFTYTEIMRNLTLIKTHPNVQLGHLYEHLFINQIDEFFYRRGLFESIDYLGRGTTYEQAGIITVDIDFFTDEAWSHKNAILTLPIDFGDDAIKITQAMHQIEAEEPQKLYINDKLQVLRELHALNTHPWQPIDDFDVLDTKGLRRRSAPIYLTDQPQAKRRTIRTTLALDTDFFAANRHQAPLFNAVSRYILRTIENQTAPRFGFFSGDFSATAAPLTVSNDMFSIPHRYRPIDLEEILHVAKNAARFMLTKPTIARLANEFQSISYQSSFDSAPDIRRILLETGTLIGAKGWRETATTETIAKILANTTLEIKYGRQKISAPLQNFKN